MLGTQKYEIKVTRAKEFKDSIAFDMEVNGVSIYGCWYREGTKNGKDWTMISFPSHKSGDGKYYNYAWFAITEDIKKDIIEQIKKVL